MDVSFNYRSTRARKARLKVFLSPRFRFFLIISLAVSLIMAGVLYYLELQFLSSLLLAIGLALLLPLLWYRYELKTMKPIAPLDDKIVVERAPPIEVVGRLHRIETPADLFEGVRGTWQHAFFTFRYGVSPQVFTGLSQTAEQTEAIWRDAYDLSKHHGAKQLSVGSLLVALLKSVPGHDDFLADVHLDIEELESSIDWLHHAEKVLGRLGKKHHFGGIARDWTSGYTPMLNRMSHNLTQDVEHGGYRLRD